MGSGPLVADPRVPQLLSVEMQGDTRDIAEAARHDHKRIEVVGRRDLRPQSCVGPGYVQALVVSLQIDLIGRAVYQLETAPLAMKRGIAEGKDYGGIGEGKRLYKIVQEILLVKVGDHAQM